MIRATAPCEQRANSTITQKATRLPADNLHSCRRRAAELEASLHPTRCLQLGQSPTRVGYWSTEICIPTPGCRKTLTVLHCMSWCLELSCRTHTSKKNLFHVFDQTKQRIRRGSDAPSSLIKTMFRPEMPGTTSVHTTLMDAQMLAGRSSLLEQQTVETQYQVR